MKKIIFKENFKLAEMFSASAVPDLVRNTVFAKKKQKKKTHCISAPVTAFFFTPSVEVKIFCGWKSCNRLIDFPNKYS